MVWPIMQNQKAETIMIDQNSLTVVVLFSPKDLAWISYINATFDIVSRKAVIVVSPIDSSIVADLSSFILSIKNIAEVLKNLSVGVSASASLDLHRSVNISVIYLFFIWPFFPQKMNR